MPSSGKGFDNTGFCAIVILYLIYWPLSERGFEMTRTELASKTVAELKALAAKMNVKLPAGAKKADIVDKLLEASAGASKKKTTRRTQSKKPLTKPVSGRQSSKKPEPQSPERKLPPGVEEPLMAKERVEESKYYTGPMAPAPKYAELPQAYGDDRIVLIVRDPYWAFAYWEVSPQRVEKEKAWFGWDSKLAVRIYDITGVQFDGTNASGYYDQEVFDRVGDWYFDLGRPAHSFCADIGLLSPEGRFLTLARSNYVTMPRDTVSDNVDEEWMLVEEDYMKIYGMSEGSSPMPNVREWWRKRRMQEMGSPGMFSRERARRK